MKFRRVSAVLSSILMLTSMWGVGSAGASTHLMTTFLKKGPLAEPANVTAAPGYGLFSCQVGQSLGQCYDPYQMRTAYGVDKLIAAGKDGTGKTIVIVDAFQNPNIVSQMTFFDNFYGLPAVNFTQVAPDGLTPFVPGDPNMAGWAEEISLDVEWAHAIAPGANIVLELGKSNDDPDLLSALNDAINHKRGDVISMSFGEADTCVGGGGTADWHQAFVNATRKGITLFASSGDQGAAQPSCDGSTWIKSASAPASDPLVTGVGGTELHAADFCILSLGCDPNKNPAPGTYLSEIAWNEGPTGDFANIFPSTLASGGGFSTVWHKPIYQFGTVSGNKGRGVADVSYNAAVLHGVLTYLDIPGDATGFFRFGGTSAGAPQWSAIIAIADQAAHHDLGFINVALYLLGHDGKHGSNAFHDVTSGNNSALEFDAADNPVSITGFNAGTGWDPPTGLGSPNLSGLSSRLAFLWLARQGNDAVGDAKWDSNGNQDHRGHMDSH
jgi:subtilase family serine protease